ncbi:MAG: fumarylacetoacetate hydrolase family protein [Kiloniellales bacterium]
MRLLSFEKAGRPALGVRRGAKGDGAMVDLAAAAPDLPGDWPAIFAAGLLDKVREVAETAPPAAMLPAEELALLPPIAQPPKIPCIGLNYVSHAKEAGQPIPTYPVVFPRWPGSLVGHGAPLVLPRDSLQFDYEAELAIVIGKAGRRIPKARALEHVAGYACFNDGSIRDFQFKSSQWAMGKNFDATGSWGPDIVTADELPPGCAGLRIGARLNGEPVQDSDIDDMIFDVATLVSTLSEVMTLEPGDLIPTGTPPGVGLGRKPPLWMKPGDTIEIEIEQIGVLSNTVVAE